MKSIIKFVFISAFFISSVQANEISQHGTLTSMTLSTPISIFNITFELGEISFADKVTIIDGEINGNRCDLNSIESSKITNVLGSNTNTFISDYCQSNHTGLIFDVKFIDNIIINKEGYDIAIFESAAFDGFHLAIFDETEKKFTDYKEYAPKSLDYPLGVVLVDLSDYGFNENTIATKIRINTKLPVTTATDQPEISAIGAINSELSNNYSNFNISGRISTNIAGWENISVTNAIISICTEGKNYTSLTDQNGKFNLENISSGRHIIRVNAPNFQLINKAVESFGDDIHDLNIFMQPCPCPHDYNTIGLEDAIHALKVVSGSE